MFRVLGNLVSRYWPLMLVAWIAVYVGLRWTAPAWEDVIEDGSFRYLPPEVSSRKGEDLFREAFSNDLLGSSVVVVVRRESNNAGLLQRDRDWITGVLKPRLEKLAELDDDEHASKKTLLPAGQGDDGPIVLGVRTFDDPGIGELLLSADGKAALVIVGLSTEFAAHRNFLTLERIETLLAQLRTPAHKQVQSEPDIATTALAGIAARSALAVEDRMPPGVHVALSGSATVGRDMRVAAAESARRVDWVTIVLVLGLLLVIYRAPFPVIIPLLTVFISVRMALAFLALLADAGLIGLFNSSRVYVTVIVYGAGVDYCMFLIARYREELARGASREEGIAVAVNRVGAAIAASAGTTMAGISMMMFAEFGKLQQAGLAMSISLFFVLCTSLTFTPAMLRLAGKWVFWPQVRAGTAESAAGWLSPTSLMSRLLQKLQFRTLWEKIGRQVRLRPGTVWLVAVALMTPFAVIAVISYGNLSYGLMTELPRDDPSVQGTKALQEHFPAGVIGPVTVLVRDNNADFRDDDRAIEALSDHLMKHKDTLAIADVRSVVHPLGVTEVAEKALKKLNLAERGRVRQKAVGHYVSDKGVLDGRVARLDVVFHDDPFSRNSIARLERLQREVARALPEAFRGEKPADGKQVLYIGATPSIRDLRTVTNSDQVRIDVLVVLAVFVILVILLRRFAISGYLIVSVLFSYLVALGVTFSVFWMLDPAGFAGLDWKVPLFLFTILIAVGEDYNIYLITRIEEEQVTVGPIEGVTVALARTGGIISSCGLIMAGTFSALLFGSLAGMQQLGFALAFGVMLDTFVVRPLLVPAYLIMLHSGRFGVLGRMLGAIDPAQWQPQAPAASTSPTLGHDEAA